MRQILVVLGSVVAAIVVSGFAFAQQRPIDTRQWATNPPQSAVGVPQLPDQRTYPLDRWGREVLPGKRGRGSIVIQRNDQDSQTGILQYGPSYFYLDRLYPGKYRLYKDKYGRKYYRRIR